MTCKVVMPRGGFASGTLIRPRVMLTAGHVTAPVKALGEIPSTIRLFASFSPTDARDPATWIQVVAATHPLMPHCPPPRALIRRNRGSHYGVTPDGQRFLVIVNDETPVQSLSVIVNWDSDLPR